MYFYNNFDEASEKVFKNIVRPNNVAFKLIVEPYNRRSNQIISIDSKERFQKAVFCINEFKLQSLKQTKVSEIVKRIAYFDS